MLELCGELKDDSIALIDAIAPPDFVVNSPLADSKGDVYNRLYSMMTQSHGALERLDYLDTFLSKTNMGALRSQL